MRGHEPVQPHVVEKNVALVFLFKDGIEPLPVEIQRDVSRRGLDDDPLYPPVV